MSHLGTRFGGLVGNKLEEFRLESNKFTDDLFDILELADQMLGKIRFGASPIFPISVIGSLALSRLEFGSRLLGLDGKRFKRFVRFGLGFFLWHRYFRDFIVLSFQ